MDLQPARVYLFQNLEWMLWNLFLAAIPYFLSLYLFRPKTKVTKIWSAAFAIFILFLPNAPYILTDIIHLYTLSFKLASVRGLMAAILQYSIFVILGVALFLKSYQRFEIFLVKKLKIYVLPFRITIFAILSIGVYLGRFYRFNSWDLFINPISLLQNLKYLLSVSGVSYIALFTIMIALLYYLYENFSSLAKLK
ncbi:MAG: DUF1361 domain-containing protein [Candidatus Woesebacteria bacterium]|nr:MAG: DUF1361 domain-containing protein [Candidatus Woesebacteria bacterium]